MSDYSRTQKYTVRSTGIWEIIRKVLAVDPNRSTGVPLNSQFRNPPPGANPPQAYDDPVTIPAGDIADNAYFERDMRRNYPRPSLLKQADIVQLLSAGSKASPSDGVEHIGEPDSQQVVEVQGKRDGLGLSTLLSMKQNSSLGIFGPNGLPPFPTGLNSFSQKGEKRYTLDTKRVEGYPEE